MTELILTKGVGPMLQATSDEDVEVMATWRMGEVIRCKVSRMRNAGYHRKYFSMLRYVFDRWEPPPNDKGIIPQKNFEHFRGMVAIGTGHYGYAADFHGNTVLVPHSVSFASMDQDTFSHLYSMTIDFLLENIATLTRDEVEEVTERLLGYA